MLNGAMPRVWRSLGDSRHVQAGVTMTVLVLSSVEAVGVRAALAAGKQVYTYTIDGEPWDDLEQFIIDHPDMGIEPEPLVVPERYRAVEGEVVELVAECDDFHCTRNWHCGCGAGVYHCVDCGRPVPPCPSGCESGRVSLGRATIQVLRVQGDDFERDGQPFVLVYDGVFLVDAPEPFMVDLDIDPEPSPGQFVVVVEFKDNP